MSDPFAMWGDVTDHEFNAIKARIGDMALEAPDLVKRLVEDLRRERAQAEKKKPPGEAASVVSGSQWIPVRNAAAPHKCADTLLEFGRRRQDGVGGLRVRARRLD
jgi:MoxR-like ATPase